jgi:Prokaryotic lipoprotein-attachment site
VMRFDRPLLKIAAAGALASALLLAGCGRKSDLDPPPASAVPPPNGQVAPPAGQPDGTTPPPKKSFFLDWLIK